MHRPNFWIIPWFVSGSMPKQYFPLKCKSFDGLFLLAKMRGHFSYSSWGAGGEQCERNHFIYLECCHLRFFTLAWVPHILLWSFWGSFFDSSHVWMLNAISWLFKNKLLNKWLTFPYFQVTCIATLTPPWTLSYSRSYPVSELSPIPDFYPPLWSHSGKRDAMKVM